MPTTTVERQSLVETLRAYGVSRANHYHPLLKVVSAQIYYESKLLSPQRHIVMLLDVHLGGLVVFCVGGGLRIEGLY